MYTTPIMVGYSFTGKLAQYIKTVPEDEMRAIRRAVGAALGCTAALANAPKPEKLKLLEEENACLMAENDDLKQGYIDQCKKNAELMAELAGMEKADAEHFKAIEEAKDKARKAEVYREMYLELLNRIVAAGGDAHG